MKITGIETHVVCPGGRNFIFVQVQTDEGITGIGEAYSCGPDEATVAAIKDFERWLVGEDPQRVEHLWAMMYNGSRFPGGSVVNSAISGIEHALWDIKGKALGVPVYQLLGGATRDKIRVYQSPHGSTPEELADHAQALIERYGYTAIKISPQPPRSEKLPWNLLLQDVDARMRAVRERVGAAIDIGVDPHARIFEPVRAYQMSEVLAQYNPFFIEEPLRPENIDALGELKAQMRVPLATGEMLYTKYEFRDLLVRNAADIIQPDICCAGGILEMKKIAGMAEAFYVTVAPHNPMGPVATAVNVQLAAAIPNFCILEYIPDDTGPRADLLKEPLQVVDGYIPLPAKPGLGIELNEAAFEKYPPKPWRRALAYRPDGSIGYI